MFRVSDTQDRSARIARAIFASLPFPVRLAYVFSVLANTDLKALGRALGVIFIKKKIQGLPDIHGKPALEFPVEQLESQHKDPSKYLPTDYLHDFSQRVRQEMLSKFKSDDLVDVIISNWLFRFIVRGGWRTLREGDNFSTVLNHTMVSMKNEGINELKKRDRSRGKSIDQTDEEGRPTLVLKDPHENAEEVYENLPMSDIPKVRKILEDRVHPDAPRYLDLLLEGWTASEILGFANGKENSREVMLPHLKERGLMAPYKTWKTNYEPQIRRVLLKFVDV